MSLFAEPTLCNYMGVPVKTSNRVFYGGNGGVQLLKQIIGALFIRGWNVVLTAHILLAIRMVTPLRICWLVTTLSTERKRMRCGEMDITRHPTTTIDADIEQWNPDSYADRQVTLQI